MIWSIYQLRQHKICAWFSSNCFESLLLETSEFSETKVNAFSPFPGNSKFSIRSKKSWSAGNGLDLNKKFNKNYPIRRIVQRIRHKKMGVIFSTEDVETENESFFDAKYIYKILRLGKAPEIWISKIHSKVTFPAIKNVWLVVRSWWKLHYISLI